uniref:Uncharacterized protein n=2 Tax=Kalmanozyma brasiliensis (strain GHG001) TaxID=1365824 RepID=V5GPB9_KALBG
MFENDLFASNLAGLDLLIKYGSADANVPPWNSRDMAMVVNGWNRRSGLEGKVKVAEVPGRPHWWDTFFSEDDVQDAIEAACSADKKSGYRMPEAPQNFTLTVFNPAEAGSKGGWRITEVDIPGRLAKLEVRYTAGRVEAGADVHDGFIDVIARNVRRIELNAGILRRSSPGSVSSSKPTKISIKLNGQVTQADTSNADRISFVRSKQGVWKVLTGDDMTALSSAARPIGPQLRIVTSKGPMVLIVPSKGPAAEIEAWKRVARRFAADMLLYGAINSQIFTDDEFRASTREEHLKHSNIVTLGGPSLNAFTRTVLANWPNESPIRFPSPDKSAQFEIQGRSFYEDGTTLLTLAPHPSYEEGLTLVAHGIGLGGISRAARLLPTRTGTMIPEWIVTDKSAEWMGEGGIQAAGWYDRKWGWSESMSHVQ